MDDRVPLELVAPLRAMCLALPEAYEHDAWVGTSWRIRAHTFAHLLPMVDGRPPAYAAAAGIDGPATLLTFQSAGEELLALGAAGPPYFRPRWRPGIVGVVLDGRVGPDELAELVTESYRLLAPKALARRVGRPPR